MRSTLKRSILTIDAFLTFLLLDALLALRPFDWVYERAVASPRRRRRRREQASPSDSVEAIVGAVTRANRFYFRRRKDCLPRALTVCRLLRRRGIAADFCLGVKKFPFGAHAWVECGGELVDDRVERVGAYHLLTRFSVSTES